jgi:phytanoyl-CoA hydroxylase
MNNVALAEPPLGQIGQSSQEYYETNGYYVYRNLVSPEKIDRLVDSYKENILPSADTFFRQTTSRYEVNKLNQHGFVKQSFLDIHDYRKFPDFSNLAKDIYSSLEMHTALAELTGFESFNLMQTMLFDANTQTQPHQDCWYLDTVPNGHLLAVWIALEDIDERAGRFFVVPKSNTLDFQSDTPGLTHEDWIARIKEHVTTHPDEVYAPALNKGDVLFWNSHTIHGSLPTVDSRFSRKSLTAHYMPSQFEFGNIFVTKKDIEYKDYNGMKFFRTRDDIPFDRFKANIKESSLYSPKMMTTLRKVQNVFKS